MQEGGGRKDLLNHFRIGLPKSTLTNSNLSICSLLQRISFHKSKRVIWRKWFNSTRKFIMTQWYCVNVERREVFGNLIYEIFFDSVNWWLETKVVFLIWILLLQWQQFIMSLITTHHINVTKVMKILSSLSICCIFKEWERDWR
jgi:hypothetical protein